MGKTLLSSLPTLPVLKRNRNNSLGDACAAQVEPRMGKIPFSSRYHRQPRKLADDYEISASVLGSGYNGEVRKAFSKARKGQKCAVKSFQLEGLSGEKMEQLEAEVENYLCMDHPHITRLYDVYESKDNLHLVMECMEGGELFDRVTEKKRFSEAEAADALRQMLLALNYIHSHGIVHRDVKLENFIYDKKGSGHLKLIDFGFSKMWSQDSSKMKSSLGTLSYVAPEVLDRSYTSQCDLWSLGVIGFILLSGYMPFSGAEAQQIKNISKGKYNLKKEKWDHISDDAKHFIHSLLEVDPSKRLTAQGALEHPWILKNCKDAKLGCPTPKQSEIAKALRKFEKASKFRRCCLEMLAWSLSNEERGKVREHFLSLDANHQGTITLGELKNVLVEKLHFADEHETVRIFEALDYNHDQEIHYSDFLAAMTCSDDFDLNDELLRAAFRRFDTDQSGVITAQNLKEILGSRVDGEKVEDLLSEADQTRDGQICFAEFVSYMRDQPLDVKQLEILCEAAAHKLPGPIRRSYSADSENTTDSTNANVKIRKSWAGTLRGLKAHFKNRTSRPSTPARSRFGENLSVTA